MAAGGGSGLLAAVAVGWGYYPDPIRPSLLNG
jgi:hypothetical protein